MKLHTLIPSIIFSLMLPAAAGSGEALQAFATYEQGKPLAVWIDARRAVFHGTAEEAVRAERERELVAFIASDALPQAKAIAIEWLGSLGSPASVPALKAAGKDPALAAPVAAAIERIGGPAAQAGNETGMPAIKKEAAEVAAFTSAIDADAASSATDDRIAAALLSNNDLLAGSALRHIRAGAGTPALSVRLLASIDQMPASRQIPLCEALAPRADAAETLRPILIARANSGDPETRAAAVKTLGRILRPDDLLMVLGLVSDAATPALSTAAKAALLRATDTEIDATLIRLAREESATRIAAIDALAARDALAAIAPLWSLTSAQDPEVMAAAYKALGTLLPPDQLDEVVRKFSASQGSAAADELGKLLWNIVRRHPEPAAAAQSLDSHAADAPAAIKEQLIRHADRIRPKPSAPEKPKPAPKAELPKADGTRTNSTSKPPAGPPVSTNQNNS